MVLAPRGVYDCAPLGFTETSRLSTMADEVRPRVYDNELIKDSEYCCPNDFIFLYITEYFSSTYDQHDPRVWVLHPAQINKQFVQFLCKVCI